MEIDVVVISLMDYEDVEKLEEGSGGLLVVSI